MRRGSWLSLLAILGCAACRGASPPAPSTGDPRSVRFAREAQKGSLAPVRETLRQSLSKPGRLQVVTGTSTGALQATFAFLGRDFDDAVGREYLDIRGDSDVMKKRFLMTRIPPDVCQAVGSSENQFDPQLMKCLYDEGEKWAQRDEAWSAEPPLEGAGP